MKKIKTLCFLDDIRGRDVEIVMPVVYFAEKYLNCEVEFCFAYDIFAIYRKNPDLVILPNAKGSWLNFLLAKYAYQNGCKVFAMVSEGNYPKIPSSKFNFWGSNTDKFYYEDYVCNWSERANKMLAAKIPEFKDRMVVCGATGFDRYKIYNFKSKKDFLAEHHKTKYKKVVGYAAWSFGKLFSEPGIREIKVFAKGQPNRLEWTREQYPIICNILEKMVKNNPDILFIFKPHPRTFQPHLSVERKDEMTHLRKYPNVIYTEEDVHNLINVSDLWLAFESTTVLEGWLLGKQTAFINPDTDFFRSNLYQGTPIVKNYEELQQIINQYFEKGKFDAFFTEDKQKNRRKIIREYIGFDDGLNHVRTGYYLRKTVQNISKKRKKKFVFRYFKMYLFLTIGKLFYHERFFGKIPKLSKTIWIFKRHRLGNVKLLQSKYYQYLDDFHAKNNLKEKINDENFWQEIIPELQKNKNLS